MKKLFLFILLAVSVYAQTPDVNKILKEVNAKFSKVRDYTVDISIKLDVSFVKIPGSKAKIYFKQPDKVYVESEGFSMVPLQGINFNPAKFLKDDFLPLYLKEDLIDGRKMDVINMIPKNDTAAVRFVKLWIDKTDKVIRKFESTAKRGGTVVTEMSYGNEIKMALPSQIKFSMDFGNSTGGGINIRTRKTDNKAKKDNIGSAIVTYSNYVINKGIDDKIFTQKKK